MMLYRESAQRQVLNPQSLQSICKINVFFPPLSHKTFKFTKVISNQVHQIIFACFLNAVSI